MNNIEFLNSIRDAFLIFLKGWQEGKAASRSTEKLKLLHGNIAKDIQQRLGSNYSVHALGIGDGKEEIIIGRYIDKKVDITICQNNKPIAGVGIKFVMQNFAQNANNYFENMLGETANIQCQSVPYFQILVLPEKIPYFQSGRKFKKWEQLNQEKLKKYITLSHDPLERYLHTPAKTLLYIVSLYQLEDQSNNINFTSNEQLIEYYQHHQLKCSDWKLENLGNYVILNNYDEFMQKVIYRIKAI